MRHAAVKLQKLKDDGEISNVEYEMMEKELKVWAQDLLRAKVEYLKKERENIEKQSNCFLFFVLHFFVHD